MNSRQRQSELPLGLENGSATPAHAPQVVRCVLGAMGDPLEPTPAFASRVERVGAGRDAKAREVLAPLARRGWLGGPLQGVASSNEATLTLPPRDCVA